MRAIIRWLISRWSNTKIMGSRINRGFPFFMYRKCLYFILGFGGPVLFGRKTYLLFEYATKIIIVIEAYLVGNCING